MFKKCDRVEFFQDNKKAIHIDATNPKGKVVDIHVFVGSDHEGDQKSCRSRSVLLTYINTTLVQ